MNPYGSHASSLRCFVDSIRVDSVDDSAARSTAAERFASRIRPEGFPVAVQVPPRWRGAAKLAVDKWNGPFAHAGYKQAIRGVLPTDPDWPEDYEAGDRRFASISWGPLLSHSGALAIGPHITDPRTGETLDAYVQRHFLVKSA